GGHSWATRGSPSAASPRARGPPTPATTQILGTNRHADRHTRCGIDRTASDFPQRGPAGVTPKVPADLYHEPQVPSRYALYALGLMVGINLLNYMDRWGGSAVAPLIQVEFDLSDFSIA